MAKIFIDVDTQVDFLYPSGALAVPGATHILPQLAALTQHALRSGSLLLSTADAHLEDDVEFATYPSHCVKGTLGAMRVPETLSPKAHTVEFGTTPAGSNGAGQIVFEKRSVDMFTVPALAEFIQTLDAEAFIVYGVVTEICVFHAVEGLLGRGKPVSIVTDAVYALEDSRARQHLLHWKAAGCRLIRTADVLAA